MGRGDDVASFALSGSVAITLELDRAAAAAVAHQSVVTVSANVTDTSGISDKDKALGEVVRGRSGKGERGGPVAGFKGLCARLTNTRSSIAKAA